MTPPTAPALSPFRRLVLPMVLVLAVLTMGLGLVLTTANPALAQDTTPAPAPDADDDGGFSVCSAMPVISVACNELIDGATWAINCGLGSAGVCADGITQTVTAGVFDYFSQWVAVGAIAAIDMVWSAINGTTTPTVDTTNSVFATSMIAARALALPLLVAAALYSLIKRDAAIALKAALLYLPGSVIGMVLSGYVITMLLAVTDELASSYVSTGETGIAVWLDGLSDSIGLGAGLAAPIILVVLSVVLLVSAIMLWLMMVVRTAAILVTYAFMPLAFAALIFPATRSWIRRLIEIQLSFILAKPVMVAILALGSATLTDSETALTGMIHASALFYLAAFSPFALMKLLPLVGDEAVSAMEEPGRAPSRVTSTAVGFVGAQRLNRFLSGSQQGGGDVAGSSSGRPTTPPPGAGGGDTGGGGGKSGGDGSTGGGSRTGSGRGTGPKPSSSGGSMSSGSSNVSTGSTQEDFT